jgi:hypothetical protein
VGLDQGCRPATPLQLCGMVKATWYNMTSVIIQRLCINFSNR